MPLGQAEVRAVFGAGSNRVAGCMVTEGKLVKNCQVAVTRGAQEIFTGKLSSLRRVKELATEVGDWEDWGMGGWVDGSMGDDEKMRKLGGWEDGWVRNGGIRDGGWEDRRMDRLEYWECMT